MICPGPRYRTNTRTLESRGLLMPADVEHSSEPLGPREVIAQAIDVVMDRDDVSRDAAIQLLFEDSSDSQRQVHEIAAEIMQQRRGD
jgi:AmiR/NasT family two-component response regulator